MGYEKYKNELDEILKEPWIIQNERKIIAIIKDDATPEEVKNRIKKRYLELLKRLDEEFKIK